MWLLKSLCAETPPLGKGIDLLSDHGSKQSSTILRYQARLLEPVGNK